MCEGQAAVIVFQVLSMNPLYRKPIRRFAAIVVVLAVLIVAWFSGFFGRIVGAWVVPSVLPVRPARGIEVGAVVYGEPPPPVVVTGVSLTLSRERIESILRELLPRSYVLLPPGVVRVPMWITGTIDTGAVGFPLESRFPFLVIVEESPAVDAALRVRCPAADINSYMKDYVEEGTRKTKKGALGDYDVLYRIQFDRMQILSDATVTNVAPGQHRLRFDGRGTVRFKVEESIIAMSATAKVKDFSGTADVVFQSDEKGRWFTYNVVIDRLRGSVHNMPEFMDRKLLDSLKKSLTKSINKQSNKERLADMRIPGWIPVDATVDIQLTSATNGADSVSDVVPEDVK